MATIHYSFTGQPLYVGNYTIKGYKQTAPTVEVVSIDVPNTGGLIEGDLTLPTYEAYIVRIFACAGSLVGQFGVYSATACPEAGIPVAGAITAGTATVSWTASTPPPATGYDWTLSKEVDPTGVQKFYVGIRSGTTTGLSVNLTALEANTHYRFNVIAGCTGGDSAPSEGFFTTPAGTITTGNVNVLTNATGHFTGYVIVRSTITLNQYQVSFGANVLPYDRYEVMRYYFAGTGCIGSSINPAIGALFTLNATTPSFDINIHCIPDPLF